MLADARRLVIIGCSGGGKSTLARELSATLGIPYIPMDRAFFWLTGWRLRDRAEIRRMVANAVADDAWIMDGTSPGTMDLRLPRADAVIWMRLPRRVCLAGVLRRRIHYHGRNRPDLPEGCPEKIDLEFLRYIWNFERKTVPKVLQALDHHGPDVPVIMLKSRRQADVLLAELRARL